MNKEKKGSKKTAHLHLLKGVLDISRSGMGFVLVEGQAKDIKIKPNDFGRAFHGDIVRVEIDNQNVMATFEIISHLQLPDAGVNQQTT